MKVGLFFGSFNPIHIGHLIVAQTILDLAPLDEVWFVVSPQNPFKKNHSLAHELDRLRMVERAIEGNWKFKATDVEFHMPRPSYTVDTLAWLSDKYPQHEFNLIMGEDNLQNFHRWKNHQAILEHYGLIVYPRPGYLQSSFDGHTRIKRVEAPLIDISATFIRDLFARGKEPKYLLADEVIAYIKAMGLYRS